MKKIIMALLSVALVNATSAQTKKFSNKNIDKIIRGLTSKVEGKNGQWRLSYQNRTLVILTDEKHNRMRIMSPITTVDKLTPEIMAIMLAAHFHRALDVKYAISNGYLWSLYMHPLAELDRHQFIDALNQVVALANNFGSTYASSNLSFGEQQNPQKAEKKPSEDDI